jgi:hypothetical protein
MLGDVPFELNERSQPHVLGAANIQDRQIPALDLGLQFPLVAVQAQEPPTADLDRPFDGGACVVAADQLQPALAPEDFELLTESGPGLAVLNDLHGPVDIEHAIGGGGVLGVELAEEGVAEHCEFGVRVFLAIRAIRAAGLAARHIGYSVYFESLLLQVAIATGIHKFISIFLDKFWV